MKLEEQVVSLEFAKKLKELGALQESLFCWKEYRGKWSIDLLGKPFDEFKDRWVSAFTVAELGGLIGNTCNDWGQGYHDAYCIYIFQCGPRGASSFIEGIGTQYYSESSDTEADARARVLIERLKPSPGAE